MNNQSINQKKKKKKRKTVEDEKTKKKIVLSKEELDMIRKIQEGDFADGYDPYEVIIILIYIRLYINNL